MQCHLVVKTVLTVVILVSVWGVSSAPIRELSGHRLTVSRGTNSPVPRVPFELLFTLPICAVAPHTGRRLKAVIYARYSTDEQSPRSIDDQVAKCRRFVESLNLGDVEFTAASDAATSGEHTHRPGIDRVWEMIETKSVDLIVAEELSRLYRHSTRAMQLLEAAVDAGIRVIAIESHIDTAEPEGRWRLGGFFAGFKAEADNRETRHRIERTMEALWRDGYAVGPEYPGYRRIPTKPATDREPAKGPFRDKRDDRWTPTILRAFEMVESGMPSWRVAQFLTESGLPQSSRSRSAEWSYWQVITLIRNPVFYGVEAWRRRRSVRKFSLGKSVQVPNAPEKVLYREMPHLAHVPQYLWYAANRRMDENKRQKQSGDDHPLHGVPRDRRGPLSLLFVCDLCDGTMYRDDGGYRCANSKRHPGSKDSMNGICWNRCIAQKPTVHRRIAESVVDTLTAQIGCFEALCEKVVEFVKRGTPESEARMKLLREREKELDRACKRLAEAIERRGDLEDLNERLAERQTERRDVRIELERLAEQAARTVPEPTFSDVRDTIDEVKTQLLGELGPEVGPLLRRLIKGKIRAVPYKLFDREQVSLRAHFELDLLKLLPEQWQQLLSDRVSPAKLEKLSETSCISLVVDLFHRQKRIVYALRILELVRSGMTKSDAARQLGLPETTATNAYKTGIAMEDQGLKDAYIKLDSMPDRPGRWTPKSDRPDVFDADPH